MEDNINNRLWGWKHSIEKAYECMLILNNFENIFKNRLGENEYNKVCFTQRYSLSYIIEDSLLSHAVILFFQIYGQGNKGHGILGNTDDEINKKRDELEIYICKKMNIQNSEYDEIKRLLKYERDKFGAHYDGKAIGYEVSNESTQFRLPGIYIDIKNQENFRNILKYSLEFINTN